MSDSIGDMRNLGPKSVQMLASIGLTTPDQLRKSDPVVVYLSVKQQHSSATLNLLWALYGAVHDRDWRSLSPTERTNLQQQLARHTQ